MRLVWGKFKEQVLARSGSIQCIETDYSYRLSMFDGGLTYFCILAKDPTDTTDLDDFVANFKPNVNQPIVPKPLFNEEKKQIVSVSMSSEDAHYEPRSLDFYTAKVGSLYNRKSDGLGIDDGTDYGDGWLEFFDASGNTIDPTNQQAITENCTITKMQFEPKFVFDIFSGILFLEKTPLERAYLWVTVAPDIPEAYGGSVPFMAGGLNLKMLPDYSTVRFDAKTSKQITYNADYHTGKIEMKVKHALGEQIGIQMLYEFYRH